GWGVGDDFTSDHGERQGGHEVRTNHPRRECLGRDGAGPFRASGDQASQRGLQVSAQLAWVTSSIQYVLKLADQPRQMCHSSWWIGARFDTMSVVVYHFFLVNGEHEHA